MHWCTYWCTPIKIPCYRKRIKERDWKSWKRKKVSQIDVPRTANFVARSLIFRTKILQFLFPASWYYSKCRFSKYFWDYLRDFQQIFFKIFRHNFRNFIILLELNSAENSENLPFKLKLLESKVKFYSRRNLFT